MSFNDIPEFRKALERLTIEYPKLIPAGARSLLWVIVGWPNGCFIGQEALANQAGLAISTKDTYLRKLTKLGFIDREQSHGRKGLQQNYRVNVRNMSNYNCLSPVVGISNPVLPTKSESLPITDAPIASNLLYAYKEDKDNASNELKIGMKIECKKNSGIVIDIKPKYILFETHVKRQQELEIVKNLLFNENKYKCICAEKFKAHALCKLETYDYINRVVHIYEKNSK